MLNKALISFIVLVAAKVALAAPQDLSSLPLIGDLCIASGSIPISVTDVLPLPILSCSGTCTPLGNVNATEIAGLESILDVLPLDILGTCSEST
ncbi:hypothetical protein EW145_g1321 [Phellinidium pouzarii]|uniref:Hydrophobin n=1 Tax=Phellinidium pouzarii TaxID=167371 RepID=A0A4S4LFI8_9AGAM|nr:hypothetical protein EW145_g1321 [Phellinidium pouzarii]